MRFGFVLGLDMLRNASAVAPPTGMASLYGTGLGQVPLHIDPDKAVMSGANVVSVPNSGGAGAIFNATAGGAVIPRVSGRLSFGTAPSWLDLATQANLVGVRMFVVAGRSAITSFRTVATGRSPDLSLNLIRHVHNGDNAAVRISVGAVSQPDVGAFPRDTSLHLFEMQFLGNGNATIMVDGAYSLTVPSGGPLGMEFLIGRLFASLETGGSPDWYGPVGDIVSLIVDGTGNYATQASVIRNVLAAKHSITLA